MSISDAPTTQWREPRAEVITIEQVTMQQRVGDSVWEFTTDLTPDAVWDNYTGSVLRLDSTLAAADVELLGLGSSVHFVS